MTASRSPVELAREVVRTMEQLTPQPLREVRLARALLAAEENLERIAELQGMVGEARRIANRALSVLRGSDTA